MELIRSSCGKHRESGLGKDWSRHRLRLECFVSVTNPELNPKPIYFQRYTKYNLDALIITFM